VVALAVDDAEVVKEGVMVTAGMVEDVDVVEEDCVTVLREVVELREVVVLLGLGAAGVVDGRGALASCC